MPVIASGDLPGHEIVRGPFFQLSRKKVESILDGRRTVNDIAGELIQLYTSTSINTEAERK